MPIIYTNLARLIDSGITYTEYMNMPVSDINNMIKTLNSLKEDKVVTANSQVQELPEVTTLSSVFKGNSTINM